MTLNASSRPGLHFLDPNPPSAVSGHDVYRSASPGGPWTLMAHNITNVGPVTHDIQHVDRKGAGGEPERGAAHKPP